MSEMETGSGPDPALVASLPEPVPVSAFGDDPGHWPEIEWDDDGYPIGEDDDFPDFAIDRLPLDFWKAARFVVGILPDTAAHCCAWCEVIDEIDEYDNPIKRIEFSTGGWSGAESIIGLIESRFDTSHFMLSWRRGGHYVFEVPMRLLTPRAKS